MRLLDLWTYEIRITWIVRYLTTTSEANIDTVGLVTVNRGLSPVIIVDLVFIPLKVMNGFSAGTTSLSLKKNSAQVIIMTVCTYDEGWTNIINFF